VEGSQPSFVYFEKEGEDFDNFVTRKRWALLTRRSSHLQQRNDFRHLMSSMSIDNLVYCWHSPEVPVLEPEPDNSGTYLYFRRLWRWP
jgi:hypothetical protein